MDNTMGGAAQPEGPVAFGATAPQPFLCMSPAGGQVRVQLDVTVDMAAGGVLVNQIGAALHAIAERQKR